MVINMKRAVSILLPLILFLFCSSVSAGQGSLLLRRAIGKPTLLSSGSVSQANMRLSIVNGGTTSSGGAFVDFSSAGALVYSGSRIVITDTTTTTATRNLVGYIKDLGIGESYGSITNISTCTNYGANPYETFDGASPTGFHAINTTGYGFAATADEIVFNSGGLFRSIFSLSLTSGTLPSIYYRAANGLGTILSLPVNTISGNNSYYGTITTATTGILQFSTGTGVATEYTISGLAVQKVLTPSATGVTITTTPNGSIYGWTSETSGFNRNDSSGYTYAIYNY
jgi:hypothetical protein